MHTSAFSVGFMVFSFVFRCQDAEVTFLQAPQKMFFLKKGGFHGAQEDVKKRNEQNRFLVGGAFEIPGRNSENPQLTNLFGKAIESTH